MEATGAQAAHTPPDNPAGPYVLRELIRDIPLGVHEEDGSRAYITCVDTWNGNLYIGTSAGELLHYVSLPAEDDDNAPTQYIFATKLEPVYNTQQEGEDKGVKKILLLPHAQKACILCNGTLTFYTLPELSPAFGGKIKQPGCLWVGGIDAIEHNWGGNAAYGTAIVICLKQKLRLIRIGNEARKIRDIDFSGSAGRGEPAEERVVPLTSLSAPEASQAEPRTLPSRTREASRSFSSPSPIRLGRGHERNVSMGAEPKNNDHLQPSSSSRWPARNSSRQPDAPAQSSSREPSPRKPDNGEAPAPISTEVVREPEVQTRRLPPNIASPTANEFLLTTGTKMDEPGVGMFVNLEGDVVRGTIEFSTYPTSLVLDGQETAEGDSPEQTVQEGYVLALVKRTVDGKPSTAIEIQRWDAEPGEVQKSKQWLSITPSGTESSEVADDYGAGLRRASTSVQLSVPEISTSLRLRRLPLRNGTDVNPESDAKRNQEEDKFVSRFTHIQANTLLYHEDKMSWVVRNALIAQLEEQLNIAVKRKDDGGATIDIAAVQRVINGIRGQESTTELDFLTLTYARQKASLLLFGSLVLQTAAGIVAHERDKRSAEEALVAGEIDPRTILDLVPPLADEVVVGEQGIWVFQGLRDTILLLHENVDPEKLVQDPKGAYGDNLLQPIKRYLFAWRKKKGFGSVADETHVFRTVDAALLHILLLLDQTSPRGPATPGSIRAELNDVVDRGVDCFDRAVELFEQYQRLYLLSRLYQSRKMTSQVLATWKRILEGEHDAGGELIEGEQDVRKYLAKLRDATLVQDYGAWLATRNPKLGVQIFADDSSRVKFQPQEAVAILKEKAPGAVKDYLEHLVFGKHHGQYVNDLIAYYLDTVLSELERSDAAQRTLLQSYETYRALRPPKPTYRQFITDNAVPEEWWHNRLRLLQLIGGGAAAEDKSYDVHALGQRLAPYSNELVPEMIILNAREGKHGEALRLLVHGLGDYDTAIRYCLLGGSRIFHPGMGMLSGESQGSSPTKEQQAQLFDTLLHEFLRLEDLSERLKRTAELLERFGPWYDVATVLEVVPEDWSVEILGGFLVQALRRLVGERRETGVMKGLRGVENLRWAGVWGEKVGSARGRVVRAEIEGEAG
ncbi:hypothetical protein LTR59_009493 [Friedmanniomyces endolithicus]|nr:hypothetical protein LTR94_014751 [Friedmanniomyces endolithicus]KAK0789843.1 hypothetical protein LTR59_009493 [Friedmanniomyces endolithicus]KAK0807918.1 hypothetical protein LTR38_004734 [Friedmanniomyces endolithicus]